MTTASEIAMCDEEMRWRHRGRDLYLDLLKRAVANVLYIDKEPVNTERFDWARITSDDPLGQKKLALRAEGLDLPPWAHTMVGIRRLDNLHAHMHDVMIENIPGDFLEAGVWRGGVGIFMAGFLKAYGATDRHVWMFDSFEGLPAPTNPQDEKDYREFTELSVGLDEVAHNFSRYNLLENVKFVRGWFRDTMQHFDAPLAVLRIDCDMYESVTQCLDCLYKHVSPGGWVVIDDYQVIKSCYRAVSNFLERQKLKPDIKMFDQNSCAWRKES